MVQIGREVNLNADRVPSPISNPWPGAEVRVVERTGSTMDDCFELGDRGMPSGTAIVAGFQERGRGRAPGRRWISPPWESLLMTVLLRGAELGFPASELPLRVGLAVSRAVEDATGAHPAIRWPNDVLLGGRKVAGILCEARGGTWAAGIGINCLQRSFVAAIADTAGSLLLASGREVRPLELCPMVLRRLREALADSDWRTEVQQRLAGISTRVRVAPVGSGAALEGTMLGLDADGVLLLRDDAGVVRRAAQGELSDLR